MGHILILFALWLIINQEDVQQPVFEKVISVNLTKLPPQHLPPINEAQRQEIAEEKRQKELAKKRKQEAKKREEKKKKAAEEAKKKSLIKKKNDAKKRATEEAKKKSDQKKKAAEDARRKADAKKKAAEDARRKADAKKKAADDARRKADAKARQRRQTSLGQHINAAISERVQQEWNQLKFSAIQFSNPNDIVKIQITISRNGKVTSARIISRAKSQALNSNAQALFTKITSSSYRFPPFHRDYNLPTMTVEYHLKATD